VIESWCAVRSWPWRRRWNSWAYTDVVDSPLKERLTGALIVVAVLVIVVPEMLSGPGKSSDASRSASDAGPPVRTYSLELGTPATARSQDQSALTPQSSELASAAPATATPAPKEAETDSPNAAPAPATASAPEAQPATVTSQAAPPPDVKPAAAVVTEVPAASSRGQWWTQLGSFSSRDNAERLARDLRGKGYSISVARIKVGARDLYRVRSGPVASREAAVALQSRLAATGHKSSLVAP
jgi:DedD protein